MPQLTGSRVLITGAAGGIGYETAVQFARAGAELILSDRDQDALERASQKLRAHGVAVHTYVVDVSDQAAVEAMAADVAETTGGVDILINNAGMGYVGALAETSLETWKTLMNVNFWGPLHHIYAFLPQLKKEGGQIVNVASGRAFYGLPAWGAYAVVKAALGVASELLHLELHRYGIHVTTVYPFAVDPLPEPSAPVTWAERLSKKLAPSPERVGVRILRATQKKPKTERVNVVGEIGYRTHRLPWASTLIARTSHFVWGRRPD